jgi:ubiquinone/menaquinone biosynthesis C-methylase UbiE
MNSYNRLSIFYDFFSERIYCYQRKELFEKLELRKGDKVQLIACGTGISLKSILEKIYPRLWVVGWMNSCESNLSTEANGAGGA